MTLLAHPLPRRTDSLNVTATRGRGIFDAAQAEEISAARGGRHPRVLILSASAGGGHVRAAEAVQLALAQVCPDAVIANVDVLSLTNAPTREFYARSYYRLVHRAPHLIGYLYDRLDRPAEPGRLDRVRSRLQALNFQRVIDLLTRGAWDLAINTHFLPAEMIASLLSAGRVCFAQMTVTTGFYAHQMWVTRPCERYFVATPESADDLARHVPRDRIAATGIPIHPAFAEQRNPIACRRLHGLSDDLPVVLQLAGGFGFGPAEQIHRQILGVDRPLHVVVVAGKNAPLKQKLESLPCPPHHRRTVLGYTTAMDELMAAADVIVSKPGGLTTSEALARGAAMVIVDPIPGQESRNSDFLLENGAAIKINTLATLSHKLSRLLGDPTRLRDMRQNAKSLGRPRAAFDVAAEAMKWLAADKLASASRVSVSATAAG